MSWRGWKGFSPRADERFSDEQRQHRGDEPVKTVHAIFYGLPQTSGAVQRVNRRADLRQAVAQCAQWIITPARHLCNFAECRLVEPAADNLAFRVAHQFQLPGGVERLDF